MSLEDSVRRALTDHAGDIAAQPDIGALVARGTQARRRRRLTVGAAVVAIVAICAGLAGPMLGQRADLSPPVVATPAPTVPVQTPASAEPRTGNAFFAGSANVPVTYAIPPGWEPLETVAVVKSGTDPFYGAAFYDVANIYADGCRWTLVDPPVGPTVDDLVTAYQKVPNLEATTATDVTVDGFAGKRLQLAVPDYDKTKCQDGYFALVQADNAGTNTGQVGEPNLWAQAPNERHDVIILDVDGTRLVIFALYPPDISAQDRADLDTIIGSLQIG